MDADRRMLARWLQWRDIWGRGVRRSMGLVAWFAVAATAASATSREKIVGGAPPANGRGAQMVSGEVNGSASWGGTVLSASYVLPAAHCFYTNGAYSGSVGATTVIVGSNDNTAGTR